MSLQSWLTHCKFRFEKKLFLSFVSADEEEEHLRKFRFEKKLFLSLVSADEEEEHLRQIEELKEGRAKKDAELTQLRSDLAQIRETAQVSQVDIGRRRTISCCSVPFRRCNSSTKCYQFQESGKGRRTLHLYHSAGSYGEF